MPSNCIYCGHELVPTYPPIWKLCPVCEPQYFTEERQLEKYNPVEKGKPRKPGPM